MDNKVSLSAPWVTFQKEMQEFFTYDPDVEVGELEEDEVTNGYIVPVKTRTAKKALALRDTLKKNFCLGNVIVTIKVTSDEVEDVVGAAFEGNALVYRITEDEIPGGIARFVELHPEVIQFFNDNIGSSIGASTFLAEAVAGDIFDVFPHGAFICTADIRVNTED